ncbi:unnamed protein product [Polarella glacialis]|uniref:methionine synthase n=1 Tax=Polarella glacialis TaxID=89957 RepID=A0A813E4M3_POLGL|nr:unnamed protein product [Polarella glacialis]
MGRGQRWKVVGCDEGGILARDGRAEFSNTLAECLPLGAVVEENDLVGDCLNFTRLSGRGPLSGWLNVKAKGGAELLVKMEKPLPQTHKKDPMEESSSKRPKFVEPAGSPASGNAPAVSRPAAHSVPPAASPYQAKPGQFWRVVGASSEGLRAQQGVEETSQELPQRLPSGAVVEEVQIVGDRLHFTDYSLKGPPSGWVSIRANGVDLLVKDVPGFQDLNKLAGQPVPDVTKQKMTEQPLSGWAKLSELYERPGETQKAEPLAALAAETATSGTTTRRRRRTTQQAGLPPLEDLEDFSEEMLVETLGFPPDEAKNFVNLNTAAKRRVLAECRALIEMTPEDRQGAFERLRKAWPAGPFPTFTGQQETAGTKHTKFLALGSCFPMKRAPGFNALPLPGAAAPSSVKEARSASKTKPGRFFEQHMPADPAAQKAVMCALAKSGAAAAPPAVEVPIADAAVAAERPDFCRLVGQHAEREQLAGAIAAKGTPRPEDVASYLAAEMRRRPLLMDAGPAGRLRAADLGEADYRGERLKLLRDSALQLGNYELLVLTKPNLVVEAHKEYLKAGADICCTNTFAANSIAQRSFKTTKLVFEMNKVAAQLAKRAAAEVTKLDPKQPRFVAGMIGSNSDVMLNADSGTRSVTFNELVESYTEQIKGLVEGGVDLLSLEAVTDALSAKAAIFAISQLFEQMKKKCLPLLISAMVSSSTGRTPGGQTAEAFLISVKHSRPLVVGISTAYEPGANVLTVLQSYGALANLSLCYSSLRPGVANGQEAGAFAAGLVQAAAAGGQSSLPNLLGAGVGALPAHLAAMAEALRSGGVVRPLPPLPAKPALQISAHEACIIGQDSFHVVGQRATSMASSKFKRRIDDYTATKNEKKLREALEICASQCADGADLLDIGMDSVASDGSPSPNKNVMAKFTQLCDADPTVGKVPLMLCSSDWRVLREGLRSVQGRCVVNGICLMLGEAEFLRIAKECMQHGAALVVMALSEDGRAITCEDKVKTCQRSYRLLRSKLDFPPEDIILDCHLQGIGLQDHPIDVIKALEELRRTCPHASLMAGVSNLSGAFGRLNVLRESMHSVFLQHAVPKGLNLCLADPGRLPLYKDVEAETRQRCEEVILSSSQANQGPLARFMAFLGFRTGALLCLPLQPAPFPSIKGTDPGAWWELPECEKEAKEAQKEFLAKRARTTAAQQKAALQALRIVVQSGAAPLAPEPGAARSDPFRATSGAAARLNAELRSRVLQLDGVGGPAQILEARGLSEADFRGADKRFPASAKGNLALLAITKPDLLLDAHRQLLRAGADICRTNTLHGDAVSQQSYGTEDAAYELNKAAAQIAKKAAAEVLSQDPQKPKFVAGVLGPSVSLSMPGGAPDSPSWDEFVQAYLQQVRGLVDGGVDLLLLDMVANTLNAKAAIYAIEEHFELTGKERLPLIINATIDSNGRTPSGQSVAALLASLKHARPLAIGLSSAANRGSSASLEKAYRELVRLCPCWCMLSGDASGLAADGLLNLVSGSSTEASALDVQQLRTVVDGKCRNPRALPAQVAASGLQLSGLEAVPAGAEAGLKLVGQRCNVQGCNSFRQLIEAYKYTNKENSWEAAVELCAQQCEDQADLLDFNFDSDEIDSQWAMGKFLRLCSAQPSIAKAPFMISSMSWPVIAEGLKNTQGKCIVNGISMALDENEFLRLANECRRYGAAIVIVAISKDGEYPGYQEKVASCQEAYRLLRTKLDFPAEDIIFDCVLTAVGHQDAKSSVREFIDAVAEVKRTCPSVSFITGAGNLSNGWRSAQMLREAMSSVFLQNAVPKGLNFAFVDPGRVPCYKDLEEPTKSMCEEVVMHQSPDGEHVARLCSFAAFLSGANAAPAPGEQRAQGAAAIQGTSVAEVALVARAKAPEPVVPSPVFKQPIETLIQATGTVNASVFQMFGSKAHAASNFHRLNTASTVKRTVHFSSISVYMGQGGSGPITGASSLMDGITLWERHQGICQYSTTVLWGAIGEIGLRKAIYGSRDVFAQFDLGQKLIGPADTSFLQRQICLNPGTWDFVGLAYLDENWQGQLSGKTASTGLGGRKSFADM